jgi:hypothetical protein
MPMDLDPNLLMLSLVPSGIGFVLFAYGRKQHRPPHLLCGLILLVYPYFAGSVLTLVGGSLVIGGGLYLMLRLGW